MVTPPIDVPQPTKPRCRAEASVDQRRLRPGWCSCPANNDRSQPGTCTPGDFRRGASAVADAFDQTPSRPTDRDRAALPGGLNDRFEGADHFEHLRRRDGKWLTRLNGRGKSLKQTGQGIGLRQ